jgi:hypothetical protein
VIKNENKKEFKLKNIEKKMGFFCNFGTSK